MYIKKRRISQILVLVNKRLNELKNFLDERFSPLNDRFSSHQACRKCIDAVITNFQTDGAPHRLISTAKKFSKWFEKSIHD